MKMRFDQIDYRELNSLQQEAYNFQKVSAVLADFGFITIPLSNDWNGADFIAQDRKDKFFKVQLKSRLTFAERYCGKDLFICFRDGECGSWYMYDHDEFLEQIDVNGKIRESETWKSGKLYHFPTLSVHLKDSLQQCRIPDVVSQGADSTK